MKTAIFFISIFIFPLISHSQITQKVRKVVPVMSQQIVYLDGSAKAASGGKSRAYYKIDLPKNTIEWYYIVTTSAEKSETKTFLDLVPQLTRLLDPTGVTVLAVADIMAPPGSATCAAYLMDKANADAFSEKADNSGGKISYVTSGTRENFREGTVQIRDAIYGTYYLGFKDPGSPAGIMIEFEVAAIVEEVVVNNKEWANDIREQLYDNFYQNLRGKKFEEEDAKDIANCLVSQMTSEKTPGEYYAMSQNEKDSFIAEKHIACSAKFVEPQSPEYEKASNFANLGWKAYENGNIERCIEFSKEALSLDSSLAFVKTNLGLCYLIKNDQVTATKYYTEALSDIKKLKLRSARKEYLTTAIKYMDDALKKYPDIKGSEEVKALYQEELKKI
ncbi:MAG: hypothetical protein HOP10_07385 [Chitinophagaceae bacterium]|nr:hypothetical protein [Chitinophagaceae bacterium]